MARLVASTTFDMAALDLSRLFTNQTAFGLADNLFQDVSGTTYEDQAAFEYNLGDGVRTIYAYGDDIVYSEDFTSIAGGSIKALGQYTGAIEDYSAQNFLVKGILVDATALVAAISTSDTADDQALFALALSGNDKFVLSAGNDKAFGFDGNDILYGRDGNDTLFGGDGNDKLSGGNGDDWLVGGAGNDILSGSAGTDTASYADATGTVVVDLRITDPQDTLGAGTDTLSAIENLVGGSGNDTFNGNGVDNALSGGDGNDTLRGRDGNDWLVGGAGNDRLSGGAGADSFVFDLAPGTGGVDTIYTYSSSAGDKIVLSLAAFATIAPDDAGEFTAAQFVAGPGATAADENTRIIYDTETGNLWYDADGTGEGEAVRFAIVGSSSHPVLDASDFLLIA